PGYSNGNSSNLLPRSQRHRLRLQNLLEHMPTFQTYNVTPILPATLEALRELSFNLWWTWEPTARRLFRELDPDLWDQTNHNPVRMLQLSRQSRLEELAQDKNFLRELKKVFQDFEKYLGRRE